MPALPSSGPHSKPREIADAATARAWTERAMTTARQLEANRGNALKSTGPRTINGKQASRRNALRHGWTAETLIEPLEDPGSYRAFEAAIRRQVPAPKPGRKRARASPW